MIFLRSLKPPVNLQRKCLLGYRGVTQITLWKKAGLLSCPETAWNEKTRFAFAVLDVSSGLFLGGVGLNQINRNHNFANLGYWVRSSQTGRGVATAATLLAAEFGFEDLGLNRIEILTATGNAASGRVAEKAGAKREGILRNRLLLHNSPHDAVIYSLISDNKNI